MDMQANSVKDGTNVVVTNGVHKGKSGVVSDMHASKTGQITITVTQSSGERFKTLAKNVTPHD